MTLGYHFHEHHSEGNMLDPGREYSSRRFGIWNSIR